MRAGIEIYFFIISFCLATTGYKQKTTVKTIYFESDSFKIEKKYQRQLDEIGYKCISDTITNLRIFAYSDTVGTIAYNKRLAEKRSLQVYKYLTGKFHLDTIKIYVTWLGEETDGAYDLHFPDAHLQQRCVDVIADFKKP